MSGTVTPPSAPTAIDEVQPPHRQPEVAREIEAMLARARPLFDQLDFRDEPQDFARLLADTRRGR
jgi:hypothetical protein